MRFEEVVDQAIAMLQRRNRVTCRLLKRQFDLDDNALEDLRIELIRGQQCAVEEDDEVLIWTGEAGAPMSGKPSDPQDEVEAENRFHALIPAVILWLQRERRATYRTLKWTFRIDETLVQEVVKELAFRQVAYDERGEGLVWIAAPQAVAHSDVADHSRPPLVVPTTVSSPDIPTSRPLVAMTDTQLNQPTELPEDTLRSPLSDVQVTVPEPARSVPDAERRQLTVMFCDLVGSTDLSGRLDPEDLREVVRAYQETAAEVIGRYEGHIAQYLGDGLLIYFGYPVAHEDDAQRAVHTGLGIVEAMGALNTRLMTGHDVELAVRIGIHTGAVVVGEMGGGGRHENLALGEAPNIAARLEGLAAPNSVVISPVTVRLVQKTFVLEELGPHELKGVSEPISIARVMRPVEPGDLGHATQGFSALVGRDEEIGLLLRRWDQSKEAIGQVVLLSGEAGIGKSSLVEGLRNHVRREGHTRVTFRCSPYHTNSAMYPIIDAVQRALGWQSEDTRDTKRAMLEQALESTSLVLHEAVPLMASLLSLSLPEDRYPALTLSPQQQRQQTQDTLVAWLQEEAKRQPVLVVWEDLHWADPSTLEILGLLINEAPTVKALHVLTFRPEFEPPWPTRSHMTPITLNRLERLQVEGFITHLARGKRLPSEVVEHIVIKTDGVPLYIEELTKMILESELLLEREDAYTLTGPLNTVAIPNTLQDSLMARLDQLNAVKEVAQLGAVLGREFPYEMLRAIASQDDETLQAGLTQLVEAELLYQRGRPPRANYIFKHALIQDAAYASLLRSTRQQYHLRVVTFLESQDIDTIDQGLDVIARHCMEAGLYEQATHYWDRIGQNLTMRSANREAVTCFEQALQALSHLPESQQRHEQEFDLTLELRAALFPLREFNRVLTSLQQAERLAEKLQDYQRLGRALGYQSLLLWATRQQHQAIEVGRHSLELAIQNQNVGMTVTTKDVLCRAHYYLSDYPRARALCTENMETLVGDLERESFGMAGFASVHARSWYGRICAETGDFSEGYVRAREAVEIAEAANHSHTLVTAYYVVGTLNLRQGNLQDATLALERGLAICLSEDIRVWFLETASVLGTVYALQRRLPEALELQEQTVSQYEFDISRRLITLGETYLQLGRLEEAREQAEQGVHLAKEAHESGFLAWGLRLLGDIAMHGQPPDLQEVEPHYQQALSLASELGMRPLQAHCHCALGALYRQMGQAEQARAELTTAIEMYREMEMTYWLPETEAALAG